MIKEDEKRFMIALSNIRPSPNGKDFATDIAANLNMNEKRILYLLDKWTDKGWWEFGVSLRSGWFTEKGLQQVEYLNISGNKQEKIK